MDKQSLKVNNSIIRISGIFESDLNSFTDRKFKEAGYIDETINDQQFHKNYLKRGIVQRIHIKKKIKKLLLAF